MSIPSKVLFLTAGFIAGAINCSAGMTPAVAQSEAAPSTISTAPAALAAFEIDLKRGEVLQLIAPETRADGDTARQTYYRSAFPIAEKLGYERLGQLNVAEKVVSDYDPGAFVFFSWPDAAAITRFEDHPDWPAIKATRPDAWRELKVYTAALEEDLRLSFDPAKHYTVVVAWLDAEYPGDYERYLAGIESAVEREGGRFVYKMNDPIFEAHDSPPTAPGQVTFVEWQDRDGFARMQKSDEYRAHQQYFTTGIERFEFYWLDTVR